MSETEITIAIIFCVIILIPICVIIFIFCYGAASKFVGEDGKDKRINPFVLILAILLFIGIIYALMHSDEGAPIGVFRP